MSAFFVSLGNKTLSVLASCCLGLLLVVASPRLSAEEGFTEIFDGKSLSGWTLLGKKGDGYGVKNGILYCAKAGGGNLLSNEVYEDFVFRFEFKLTPGGNNGIAIRAPFQSGSLAYQGMEIQILDDTAEKYADLLPAQYHGSVYKVAAAKRGALNPVGEWNHQEIRIQGTVVRVTLNDVVIVETDLASITDPKILKEHPGIRNLKGRIGFLGHNDYVEFRNIRIRRLN